MSYNFRTLCAIFLTHSTHTRGTVSRHEHAHGAEAATSSLARWRQWSAPEAEGLLLLRRLQDPEGAHQALVDRHHLRVGRYIVRVCGSQASQQPLNTRG